MGGSQEIMNELVLNQRQNIPNNRTLTFSDLKRIAKNIDKSVFDKKECNIWKGYVTKKPNNRGTYVNFYFKKKKLALHRLLYINFVGELENDEYLKFTCKNKGVCCNVNHMKKLRYDKEKKVISIKKDKEMKIKEDKKKKDIEKEIEDEEKLILSFE